MADDVFVVVARKPEGLMRLLAAGLFSGDVLAVQKVPSEALARTMRIVNRRAWAGRPLTERSS